MRPTPSSQAVAAILRDLIDTRDGASYFAERVWGVSLQYDLGDGHPLVGRSAPHFTLSDGTKLGALLSKGQGLLLDFNAGGPLRALASRWGKRIAYRASDAQNQLGLSAVLLRPDGVVAWAAQDRPNVESAHQAVSRWFGKPLAGE